MSAHLKPYPPLRFVIIVIALATLCAEVVAQCPTTLAEGTTTGDAAFGPGRSQMWFNDGAWWGVFSDNTTGIHIYSFPNNAATQGPIIDANIVGIPDALWDGTSLYVMVWKSVSLATFYKLSYNSVTQSYSLVQAPTSISLNGSSTPLVIGRDSTGKLWATYTGTEGPLSDGTVRVIWTTSSDHATWNTTGAVLASGLTPNLPETSTIISFGGDKIGVAWSNQPAMEIAFRYHNDGDAETAWTTKEIIDSGLGPRGLGPVVDDHLSMKATSNGRVYLVVKDRDNDGTPAHKNEAQIWMYRRDLDGVWESKTRVELGTTQSPSSPLLLLDETANVAYVIFYDSFTQLNFITHSPLDNPFFAPPCGFSNIPSAHATSTKQNLTSVTGLMAALSTGHTSTNTLVFRRVALLTQNTLKCDVAPRSNGNGIISIVDWVQMGRFVAGLDTPNPGNEFQRADAAPRATNGDGFITISDWVQCGRYAAGVDPLPGGSLQKPQDAK